MNDEKNKKLNEDVTIAVNAPLSLGIKNLKFDDVARAPAIKQVLKDDRLPDWDHILLFNAMQTLL